MKINSFILFTLVIILGMFIPIESSAMENELLLRDNLKRAQAGDYLVTAQNKNFTILLIRNKEADHLSIEEITVPLVRMKKEKQSWRNWIEKGAPGHTCWVMYHIDLSNGAILQTFSYTKNEWITIPQSQNFLSTLLNLRLRKIPENERKRVGPPPASDSLDRRSLWQPTVVVEGKTIPSVSFDAWRTRWPKDSSELAGKAIEVYIPKETTKYPSYFPYWLQISGMIGKAKVRIVDSGTGLGSSARLPSQVIDNVSHSAEDK